MDRRVKPGGDELMLVMRHRPYYLRRRVRLSSFAFLRTFEKVEGARDAGVPVTGGGF